MGVDKAHERVGASAFYNLLQEMSLEVDKFFIRALRKSDAKDATEGRIFGTARTTAEEQEDKLPYIVVTFDGLTNAAEWKDCVGDSDNDVVKIGVLCCAGDRESLATLTQVVRKAIRDQEEEILETEVFWSQVDWSFEVNDWTLSAGPVEYDPQKPCHYQTLNYEVETSAR